MSGDAVFVFWVGGVLMINSPMKARKDDARTCSRSRKKKRKKRGGNNYCKAEWVALQARERKGEEATRRCRCQKMKEKQSFARLRKVTTKTYGKRMELKVSAVADFSKKGKESDTAVWEKTDPREKDVHG